MEAFKNAVKILVVDDCDINRKLHKLLLEGEFQIDTAANGLEAVNAFNDENYSAVIMDVDMPIMDGIEATKEIRKKSIIPIIGVTGNHNKINICLSAGMNEVLFKPLNVDLKNIIKLWLK